MCCGGEYDRESSGEVKLRTVATSTLKTEVLSYVPTQCWYSPTRLCGVVFQEPTMLIFNVMRIFKAFLLNGGYEYGKKHFPVKLQKDMGYHCNPSPLVLQACLRFLKNQQRWTNSCSTYFVTILCLSLWWWSQKWDLKCWGFESSGTMTCVLLGKWFFMFQRRVPPSNAEQ